MASCDNRYHSERSVFWISPFCEFKDGVDLTRLGFTFLQSYDVIIRI